MDNEDLLNEQVQDEQEEVEQVQEDTPQEEESGEQPEFVLDENGNLQWNTDEFDHLDNEDSQEEQPSEEQEEEHKEPEEEPKYKVTVDGQEVEVTQEELLRGYMRQSDYTRKTQQLANQRQQFEQLYAQRQVPPQQYQQQNVPEQPTETLNDVAKRMAAQSLGLESPEDLSELDFDHITAVVEAKQALLNQRNAMMSRKQNIDNLEAQLRSEEPRYDEIMANVNQAMQNIPVSQFYKLKQAYAEGNPEPLREFFREVQKDYYSKAIQKVDNKRNKPVPKVVPSGNTPVEKQAQRKRIDFRKLGSMSTDQKAKMLLDLGFVD